LEKIMASARVERVLDEIAALTPEEQRELARAPPRVVRAELDAARRMSALEEAIANRERIRARMAADGQPVGSIAEDLDEVREEPLGRARRR
jgi:hypothetical protein